MGAAYEYRPRSVGGDGMTFVQVKRLKDGCCGMEVGQIYEAEFVCGHYFRVHLADGTWTSPHWGGDFFEVVT